MLDVRRGDYGTVPGAAGGRRGGHPGGNQPEDGLGEPGNEAQHHHADDDAPNLTDTAHEGDAADDAGRNGVLLYVKAGNNKGMAISGLDKSYSDFITGSLPFAKIAGTPIPNYVWIAPHKGDAADDAGRNGVGLVVQAGVGGVGGYTPS